MGEGASVESGNCEITEWVSVNADQVSSACSLAVIEARLLSPPPQRPEEEGDKGPVLPDD